MKRRRHHLLSVLFAAGASLALHGSARALDENPFDALRSGRVRPLACGGGSGAPPVAASPGGARAGVPGRESVPVGADGSYELHGVPVATPVRAALSLVCGPLGHGAGRPWLASPTLVLDAAGGYRAEAPIEPPGAEPAPLFALDASGPAGVRTITFALPGTSAPLELRAETVSGEPAAGALAHPAVVLQTSDPSVASVSPGGQVTAAGPGIAWIRVAADGEWSQVLVHVDLAADLDGDGLPDSWEVANGLDPNDPADAGLDPDADGLTSREEFELGTDPREDDTDGDLLTDGVEVEVHGTDPRDEDTDGDSVTDRAEITAGTDPFNPNSRPGPAFTPAFRSTRALSSTGIAFAGRASDHVFALTDNGRLTSYRVNPIGFFVSFLDFEQLPGAAGTHLDLALDGNRVLVAAGAGGLQVLDAVNPVSLALLTTVTGLGTVQGVVVETGIVYVRSSTLGFAALAWNGSTYAVLGSLGGLPAFTRMAVSGPLAFLGSPGTSTLLAIDVSDPASPREAGRFIISAASGAFSGLAAAGTTAYIAHGARGLVAVSAADPAAMTVIDDTALDFPSASFDSVAIVGNVMAAHTTAAGNVAQLFRLADGGTFSLTGSVSISTAGALQLAFVQNYLLARKSADFTVSEILPAGDRAGTPPAGEILVRQLREEYAPGASVLVETRAADDVYLESVRFFVDGEVVLDDSVPPFRLDLPLAPERPAPYTLEVEGFAVDLGGNGADLGFLRLRVGSDLDGDGITDALDTDRDGDGVPDFEERFPGADGFVSDPGLTDTDGDGIDDGEEVTPGADGFITDPSHRDTDGDGLSDPYEITVTGTDPSLYDTDGDGISDGDEDLDGDGLSNRDEELLGTDPSDPDSDDDGLRDGLERDLGLDPLRADTDGDGLADGNEDTDGDGLRNSVEVARGTDPRRADTDGDGFDDGTEDLLGTDPRVTTDFSGRHVTFTGRTIVLRGPVRVRSLTLAASVVTVPPPDGGAITPLELDVVGALSVDAGSRVDVSGRGYRGGLRSGWASPFGDGPEGVAAGGALTGGSHGGLGAPGAGGESVQGFHGDFRAAETAGGGGSAEGSALGGNGGGVLWVRAADVFLGGLIAANGEGSPAVAGGGGAGGSIRIECNRLVGAGAIRAEGGDVPAAAIDPGGGGGGRIAILTNDTSGFVLENVSARGGRRLGAGTAPASTGGAGTVFIARRDGTAGELIIDNAGSAQDEPRTVIESALEGTIAELGDDFLVRLEGSFPEEVVGLFLDPDVGDDDVRGFEILEVDGNRLSTPPGLLDSAQPGAAFGEVLLLDRLTVRRAGSLVVAASLALGDAFSPLVLESGGELAGGAIYLGESDRLELDDGFLAAARLLAAGGSFAELDLDGATVILEGEIDAGMCVLRSSTVVAGGTVTCGDLSLTDSLLTVPESSVESFFPLDVFVTGTLTVDAASAIDATGRGYAGGRRGGNGDPRGITADFVLAAADGRTGGSHGGLGGYQGEGAGLGTAVAPVYDSYFRPERPGGGGSGRLDLADEPGHNGGGLVRIRAATLALDGLVAADGDGLQIAGNTSLGGGGAGGGIVIDAGVLSGSGEVSARGGSGDGNAGSGSGGGGRIAIHYTDRTGFSGEVHAEGGGLVPDFRRLAAIGGAGTVLWRQALQAHGDLIVDNDGRAQIISRTPLRAVRGGTIRSLAPSALEGSIVFPVSDTGLRDQWVVVNGRTQTPFRIASNTASVLTTDPASGDMTAAGVPGNSFQGAIRLNNLTVTGSAFFITNGDLIIIVGGTVTVSGGGALTAPPVVMQ
jgi:hypothetical protein